MDRKNRANSHLPGSRKSDGNKKTSPYRQQVLSEISAQKSGGIWRPDLKVIRGQREMANGAKQATIAGVDQCVSNHLLPSTRDACRLSYSIPARVQLHLPV